MISLMVASVASIAVVLAALIPLFVTTEAEVKVKLYFCSMGSCYSTVFSGL